MNLYLILQDVNNEYDTYDAAVVCAESELDACSIYPGGDDTWDGYVTSTWAPIDSVNAICIGVADENIKRGVVLSSFNAG